MAAVAINNANETGPYEKVGVQTGFPGRLSSFKALAHLDEEGRKIVAEYVKANEMKGILGKRSVSTAASLMDVFEQKPMQWHELDPYLRTNLDCIELVKCLRVEMNFQSGGLLRHEMVIDTKQARKVLRDYLGNQSMKKLFSTSAPGRVAPHMVEEERLRMVVEVSGQSLLTIESCRPFTKTLVDTTERANEIRNGHDSVIWMNGLLNHTSVLFAGKKNPSTDELYKPRPSSIVLKYRGAKESKLDLGMFATAGLQFNATPYSKCHDSVSASTAASSNTPSEHGVCKDGSFQGEGTVPAMCFGELGTHFEDAAFGQGLEKSSIMFLDKLAKQGGQSFIAPAGDECKESRVKFNLEPCVVNVTTKAKSSKPVRQPLAPDVDLNEITSRMGEAIEREFEDFVQHVFVGLVHLTNRIAVPAVIAVGANPTFEHVLNPAQDLNGAGRATVRVHFLSEEDQFKGESDDYAETESTVDDIDFWEVEEKAPGYSVINGLL